MGKITKNIIIAGAIASTLTLSGCLKMVGEMTAGMLTSKTDDLNKTKIILTYTRNHYTPKTKTTTVEYSKNLWKEGENSGAITLLKNSGFGFIELDGTVSVNGTKLKHLASGTYVKTFKTPEVANFKLQSKKGQTYQVSIAPLAPVKIVSINGSTRTAKVDLSKDLDIKLKNPKGTDNTYLKVSMLVDAVGTRDFYPVGIFKSTDNLTIPAKALRHATSPNNSFYEFNKGSNYLMVERFTEKVAKEKGIFVKKVSRAMDTRPVTLSGKMDLITNTKIEGSVAGDMNYTFVSNNATFTKPFSFVKGKKFALASLTVRGILSKSETTTSSSSTTIGNTKMTTTRTTTQTWKFPKLSDKYWNTYMNDVYAGIRKTLTNKYGIKWVSVSKVVATKAYKNLEAYEDKNTEVAISKSLRGTKNLYPTSLSAMTDLLKDSFGFKTQDPKLTLMKELGVDGLVSITIDLDMPKQSKIVLKPTVGVKIVGKGISYDTPMIDFMTGSITAESGRPFSKSDLKSTSALNKITRGKDVIAALSNALDKMEKIQKEEGYHAAWALK